MTDTNQITSAGSDYRKTLNITLSDKDTGAFPQRGNLPTKEPDFQKRWDTENIYRRSVDKPAPKGKFILHDGPPYSNGNIHLGHALNKVAKDIITRFRTMQGYSSPYIPGWDNHGMPIENAVARKFREEKRSFDRVTLRRACRTYAEEWIDIQREQFKRLGVRGDWENPYLTMSSDMEAKIVEVFGELAEQGYIYRGLKPVLWCATCETALADAEVEYEDHTSNSIYVRFPLREDPVSLFPEASAPCYVVIWTTTPWTIPANLAVAAHPDAEYGVYQAEWNGEKGYYLLAQPLAEATFKAIGSEGYELIKTVQGVDLAGLVFSHPLFGRPSPVLTASYVTMDAGTGIVHTAPGHGKEDFESGQKYGLEILNPVDPSGRYTKQAGEFGDVAFEGLRVTVTGNGKGQVSDANKALLTALQSSGHLMAASKYDHSYPHCWRCHSPLIFRATVQWFMNIDHEGFREKAVAAINDVTWFPKVSINRITTMVANRPDWCVSRQRAWGVGIPAFYCDACGETILTKECVQAVADMTRRESSDAWYVHAAEAILPEGFQCPHCGVGAEKLRKETDVLDVWFDSGSTNRAVLENQQKWNDLRWPAEVYLEGGDQHRGWFNSSLMIACATKGAAPYKSVVTNGWTLDEHGRQMHKSLGNVVSPLTVIEKYGADVVRFWVVSQNFMEDTRCGDGILKQVGEMYRRVRNTFRFLVNNLYDFDAEADMVGLEEMEEIDRWILEALNKVVQTCEAAYEVYEFHLVYQATLNFCSVELSSFYLDVLKDRLYASGKTSRLRRSAQTAMYQIAETLARLLAPILVHTTEEVWDYLKTPSKPDSVHLAELPTGKSSEDSELLARWQKLLETRDLVNKALEEARQSGIIGNPLEAQVLLPEAYRVLNTDTGLLANIFLVSQVGYHAEEAIKAIPADGKKCARCWLIRTDLGVHPDHPDLCGRCTVALELC